LSIDIKEITEKALEQAFARALDQTIQNKTEDLFKRVFAENSPLSQKLQEKIDQGFQRFIENGIRWERKKPGFKK
jgi:hypothetical protein